jgi:pimeloyl-ACP methyl ester carboxylesterase
MGLSLMHFAVTQDQRPTDHAVKAALDRLSTDGPVVIMLHGYKYDPDVPNANPHRLLFAFDPYHSGKRTTSLPRQLGLNQKGTLAVGFAWRARGTIWHAHRNAARAAHDLGALIRQIKRLGPNRQVHIVAHSLGARVALCALEHLDKGDVGRMILITPAAFECELRKAQQTPAGQTVEIINVRARANLFFDLLLWLALPHWGYTMSFGRLRCQNMLDLVIDHNTTLNGLETAGFAMTRPNARICHWSGYLRQDICAVYQALLHRPQTTPLPYLQALIDAKPSSRSQVSPATIS